jgi:hypothetical protein
MAVERERGEVCLSEYSLTTKAHPSKKEAKLTKIRLRVGKNLGISCYIDLVLTLGFDKQSNNR